MSEEMNNLPEKLLQIHHQIFNQQERIILRLTGENRSRVQDQLLKVATTLPRNSQERHLKSHLLTQKSVGFVIPTEINFVSQAQSMKQTNYQQSGAQVVIMNALRMNYLWQSVRAQGGAYGVSPYLHTDASLFGVSSYRDPNIAQTLKIFHKINHWLTEARLSPEELERNIIGTIGSLDNSAITPASRAWKSFMQWLQGVTAADRQQWRKEVLETSIQDFKDFGEVLDNVANEDKVDVIVGNRENIKAYQTRKKDLEIVDLFG